MISELANFIRISLYEIMAVKMEISKQNTLFLILGVGALALSACSTNNTASSRYGDAHAGCIDTVTCVGIVDRGYWVTPLHHIQTVEKEVVVEKEVIKQLPPEIIYQATPCPVDTVPDSDGACIRTVTVESPPSYPSPQPLTCPEGTIPGYGGFDCIPIRTSRK